MSDLSAELDAVMARAGLTVSAAQRDRMLPNYTELRELLELLRGRPASAEPSNVYSLRP